MAESIRPLGGDDLRCHGQDPDAGDRVIFPNGHIAAMVTPIHGVQDNNTSGGMGGQGDLRGWPSMLAQHDDKSGGAIRAQMVA